MHVVINDSREQVQACRVNLKVIGLSGIITFYHLLDIFTFYHDGADELASLVHDGCVSDDCLHRFSFG